MPAAAVIAREFSTASGGGRFDLQLLRQQASAFHDLVLEIGLSAQGVLGCSAPSRQQQEAEEEGRAEGDWDAAVGEATRELPPTPTDAMWRAVFALPRLDCSEWFKFIILSYAMVLGTNDNERAHSRVKMLRTGLRNKLSVKNLATALRVILHPSAIDPKRAFAKWVRNTRALEQEQ